MAGDSEGCSRVPSRLFLLVLMEDWSLSSAFCGCRGVGCHCVQPSSFGRGSLSQGVQYEPNLQKGTDKWEAQDKAKSPSGSWFGPVFSAMFEAGSTSDSQV